MLKFTGNLGRGLQEFRSLDETSLDAKLHIVLDKAFHGFNYKFGAQLHEFVVKVSGGVRGLYVAL